MGANEDPGSCLVPPAGRGELRARVQAKRLIAAANELLALARELERCEVGEEPLGNSATAGDSSLWGELARQAYSDRRRRTEIFESDTMFGEPAWDILLDLFIAAKERKLVPVTSACIGAAVPLTTALRWLQALEKDGLVVRESDPRDARRIFVRLSAEAYSKMVSYFAASSRPVHADDQGALPLVQRDSRLQRARAGA